MNRESEPSLIEGTRPEGGVREVRFAGEEVRGHLSDTETEPRLRCWNCRGVFPVSGSVSEEVYYVCSHCMSLNRVGRPGTSDRYFSAEVLPPRAGLVYRDPAKVESVFLRDTDGEQFEIPLESAAKYLVSPERAAELGHAPFPAHAGEVEGRCESHGDAQNAVNPGFHVAWEYGCYFDESLGGFYIAVHRHPYGDERAIAARTEDFC